MAHVGTAAEDRRFHVLDGHPLLPSQAAAELAWEVARPATWQLWARDPTPFPPVAAERLDGITRDPDTVAAFRARRPAAAEAITDELALFVAVVARDVAERERLLAAGSSRVEPEIAPHGP